MIFFERKYAGIFLRCSGFLMLGLAVFVGRHLFASADPTAKERASAYLLAMIGVVAACAGSAMAVLGRHLFDEVELSARWTIHAHPRKGLTKPALRDAD